MPKILFDRYRARVASGELKRDFAQEAAAKRLEALAAALKGYRPARRSIFAARRPPRGIYLWGDVGRGKSMLMDLFFAAAPAAPKTRIHFNAFMVAIHARIHEWRNLDRRARSQRPEFVREAGDDPIAPVALAIANRATLLCFDEFQVNDVADAMILGRLFEQLFARGVVIVATSNIAPARLYEGGLNRQLFLPFIAMIEDRLGVVELSGPRDYRLDRMAGLNRYIAPLGPKADAAMDAAWRVLAEGRHAEEQTLKVLGRELVVPRAANGVARFTFDALCVAPLAAADYLAIAHAFDTVLIDRIPVMGADLRNAATRFTVLIDTLYDEVTHLVCSAAAPPHALYSLGEGEQAFRRTASRLMEMQSDEYLRSPGGRSGESRAVRQP
ncbi:MAG TPA: cell division protein ZapE [Rhizomicrobium sp.]